MRTQEQMEARGKELDTIVESLYKLPKTAIMGKEAILYLAEHSNKLCIERDAIRWCLDETRNPYPVEKPETT